MKDVFPYMALMAAAASLSPLQSLINTKLAQGLGHTFFGTFINFFFGFMFMIAVLMVVRPQMPELSSVQSIPWWAWCGGILGSIFITTQIVAVPHLGAALLFATIIATQLTISLLLDHFGILVNEPHSINLWRATGAAFIIFGVFLIQKF